MSRAVPDLDAEQEVDFGRYWRALVARWWLPVVGVVAGAIIGALVTVGGGSGYHATASVYLGNPLAPGGGAPVSSAPTVLAEVESYLASSTTLRQVSSGVGLRKQYLEAGHVTLKPISGVSAAKVGTPAPLLAITVDGAPARKIVDAANRLADLAATHLSGYARVKQDQQRAHLAFDQRQLAQVATQVANLQAQQRALNANKSHVSPTDYLIEQANLNTGLQFYLGRQTAFEADQFAVKQQLKLSQDIEAGHVYSEAAAQRNAGPSKRSGVAIGAFIGLILGIFAALLWEPLGLRARPQAQS
jgi:uncharacterized protein involved in exopolysaccharide biosynthesis